MHAALYRYAPLLVFFVSAAFAAESPEVHLDEGHRELAVQAIAEQIRTREGNQKSTAEIADEIRAQVFPLKIEVTPLDESAAEEAAGEGGDPASRAQRKTRGTLSVTWGYHRGWMSQSDVRFSHPDGRYDFVAYDVKAVDRHGMDAALPKRGEAYHFDVPQYQASLRYTFPSRPGSRTRFGLQLRQIHSKYIPVAHEDDRFEKGQDVWIRGRKGFDGNPVNGMGKVGTYSTVYWEYTDGLNEATLGAFAERDLLVRKWVRISTTFGVGAGVIVPATYSVVGGLSRDHVFDVSGQSYQADAAVKATFWNVVFLEGLSTGSFVDVTNGRLADGGRIRQQFFHLKVLGNLGFDFPIGKPKHER